MFVLGRRAPGGGRHRPRAAVVHFVAQEVVAHVEAHQVVQASGERHAQRVRAEYQLARQVIRIDLTAEIVEVLQDLLAHDAVCLEHADD